MRSLHELFRHCFVQPLTDSDLTPPGEIPPGHAYLCLRCQWTTEPNGLCCQHCGSDKLLSVYKLHRLLKSLLVLQQKTPRPLVVEEVRVRQERNPGARLTDLGNGDWKPAI